MFHNNNNNNNNIYQIRNNNNGIQSSPSTTSLSSASPSSSSPLMRGNMNMNTTNNNTNNSTNSNNNNSFLSKIANSINAKKQQQQQQQQQQQVPRSPSATTTTTTTTTTTSNTIASTSSPISIKTNHTNHAVNINISSPLQTNNINTNINNNNNNNNNNNGSGSSVPVSITQTKKSTLAPTKLVLSSSLSPPHQSHNHQHNGWKKTNGSSLSSSNITASALNRRKSHSSSLIQSFYSEIESTLSSSLSSDDTSSFNNSYYSSSFSSSSLPSTAVSTHNNTQYGADRVGAVAAGDCFETECLANILSSSSSFSSSAAGNYRSLSAMHHQHQQQKQQEPQRKQQQLPQQRRDKSTSSEGCDADVNNDDDDDEDEDHHSNAIKVKKYTKKRRKTIATFKIDAFSDSDDDDEDDDNEDDEDEDEDDNNSDDDHDENKNDSSSASSNGASHDKTKRETKNRTSRSFSTGTTSAGRKWFSKQFVSSGEEDSEASDRSHNSVDQDDEDSTGATVSSSTTPTFNATISSLVTRRPSSTSQEPLGNSDNSDDASSASAPINVDNVDKKEVLLLFLLQHVCRQFTPDPTYFKSMCTQLLEYGYLSDSRYLDHNFLKSVCKDFMLDVISNWPAFSEAAPQGEITEGGAASKSKLRRSESVGSFLSGLGRDMEMSRRGNPLVSSTELPFFDFMFYSTSRFKQDWGSKAKLGKGAFGSVFRSRHRIDGHEYAIKRIKFCFRNKLELEQTYAKVIREVKLLASLDHPNIVRYNQAWFEPSWKDPDYGEQENSDDDEEDDFDSEKVDDFESNINDGSTVNSGSSGFANLGVDANIKRANDDCANNVQFSFDEEADPTSPFTPSMPLNSDNVKFECSSDDDSVISLVQLPEEPHPYDKYQSFIAPSPQDMSYLEYAIKQKQQGTATRQPIVPHRSITEKVTNSPAVVDNSVQQAVKNLLAEMFNEKKNKFEMFLFIQMQLCQQNTLEDYMWNQNRVQQCVVDYGQCMNFFKQIAEGVAYIHSKELMHRDLKPKNIFITNDNIIKIGDFGLAKSVRDNLVHTKSNKHGTEHGDKQIVQRSQSPIGSDLSDHTSGVGTYFYASPEQYATSMYDDKADVFSLGVILFEMLHPFATKSERAHILTGLRSGKIPDSKQEKYPEEMELVKRCIDSAPMSRPTAREVLTITKGILLRKQKRNVNGQKSYAHLDSSVNSPHIAQTNDEVATTKPVTNDLDVRMLLQQKDDEIMQLRAELERLRRNQK